MNNQLLVALLILSSASFLILLYKSKTRKDISILGAAMPRLYIVLACSMYLFFCKNFPIMFIHVGVMLMFVGDIFSALLRLFSARGKAKALDHAKQVLNHKFYAALDLSLVPFFSIDLRGNFEYVNHALAAALGYDKEQLQDKNIFRFLDADCAEILDNLKTHGKADCRVHTVAGIRKARIIGQTTVNGHETITGSIYLQ